MPTENRTFRREATLAERLREEMTAWDAVLKQSYRTATYNPDDLLLAKGADTYETMMTDAMVRAAINTKRYALLAKPWQVLPCLESGASHPTPKALEVRDFVEDALSGMVGTDGTRQDFRKTLFQMMSAFYRGYSIAEMVWRLEERGRWKGRYMLRAIKSKPPKQTGFEVDDFLNVCAITNWTPQSGMTTVARNKCIVYIYSPRDEMPYGDSDLRAVYKHWWSKDALIRFWNLCLQKYGSPLIWSHAVPGMDSNRLLESLEMIQQDSCAVFPPEVTPQLLEASHENADTFLTAIDWHNQQIALGILLQTLTTGEGRRVGSLALGKVHFDILLYVLESAKTDIEAVVNTQIVAPLVELNFATPERVCPQFSLGAVNERNLEQMAQVFDVLLRHGVAEPKEQVVRDLFDLPPLETSTSE